MQLQYQKLPHQTEAIRAVVDLFKGENGLDDRYNDFVLVDSQRVFANHLTLDWQSVLENLHAIQAKNGLPLTGDGSKEDWRFTVEMETGTGKTYVYLRTILQLNELYGLTKFVIVVPSVAIREGVLQSLKSTKAHFDNQFNHKIYRFSVYDSKNPNQIRDFAGSQYVDILVMNIQAFEKDDNIINQSRENGRAIDLLQAVNPVVIIDEPQNISSEKRQTAIDRLNPLFTVGYSATHKQHHHKVYSLNPVQAFEQGLVKKIAVKQVVDSDNNGAFVELVQVVSKSKLEAKVVIHQHSSKGVNKKTLSVRTGDDLFIKSKHNISYQDGFVINSIDRDNQSITLSNGQTLKVGANNSVNQDAITKEQIRQTIIEHLNKEKKLLAKGINAKVLSLFFIDKVKNYRTSEDGEEKGKFYQWFEEFYQALTGQSATGVHDGYFSQDKQNKNIYKDTSGSTQADNDTYQLIMQDKERLLSLNEPLRFIFSHSALREGWDNPNVFQICTLNETASVIKKRQEIGRGLRLAVDSDGKRFDDEMGDINELTIIPNESYDMFAKKLQQEYEADGMVFTPTINNKKDECTVSYRSDFQIDPKFIAIWESICQKVVYNVCYDSQTLIDNASQAIKTMGKITAPKLNIVKAKINPNQQGITSTVISDHNETLHQRYAIPDIFAILQNKTGLTRQTLYQILVNANRFDELALNPQKFIDAVSQIIKEQLQALMVDGVCYQQIGLDRPLYEQTLATYFDSYSIYKNNHTFKVKNSQKTIYNGYVDLDSATEKQFATDCENFDEQVRFYFKLPKKFKIPTPIGNYNPDWAILWQSDDSDTPRQVHFIAETKNTGQSVKGGIDEHQLKMAEKQKIHCAKQYFNALPKVRYQVVQKLSELNAFGDN